MWKLLLVLVLTVEIVLWAIFDINPILSIPLFFIAIIALALISFVWQCFYQAFTGRDVLSLNDNNSDGDNDFSNKKTKRGSAAASKAKPLGIIQRFTPATAVMVVASMIIASNFPDKMISPFIILGSIMMAAFIFIGISIACGAFKSAKDADPNDGIYANRYVQSHTEAMPGRGYRIAAGFCMFLGGLAIAYGFGAFMLSAFVSGAGSSFLSETFEWPMGYTGNVQRDRAGNYYARHDAASRLQVYNSGKVFQKGWNYNANGGVSNIRLIANSAGGEELEVITARGNKLYRYTLDGKLLRTEQYDYKSNLFKDIGNTGEEVYFPISWWKLGLLHPFSGWLVGAMGMLLLFIGELLGKRGKLLAKAHRSDDASKNVPGRSMGSATISSAQTKAEFAGWLEEGKFFKQQHTKTFACNFTSECAEIIRHRRGTINGWIFFGIWFSIWTTGCLLMLFSVFGDGAMSKRLPVICMLPPFLGAEIAVAVYLWRNYLMRPVIILTPDKITFTASWLLVLTRQMTLPRESLSLISLARSEFRNDPALILEIIDTRGRNYALFRVDDKPGINLAQLLALWAEIPEPKIDK